MKKFKRIFIGIVFILLTQVFNTTHAVCDWVSTTQSDCGVYCRSVFINYIEGSETKEQVMAQLMERWDERVNCQADGVYLRLGDMNYQNFNVEANWFTAQVKVKELRFEITSGSTIESNAFNSTAFQSVTKLVFPSLSVSPIRSGIFNGLKALEELVIESTRLQVIENGVLDPLTETLKRFSVKASSSSWSEIRINGFTGSERLKALEYMKINYNLKSTITHQTFIGLQDILTLDLSQCQIETIGAGAFDPMSQSIKQLDLRNNLIRTLPDGIFSNMIPNQVTTVLLNGNKWVCDCNLMPFKTFLIEHVTYFDDSFKCNNPTELRNSDVIPTNFCDTYVPPETTQSTPTTTTSTSTTTQSTPTTSTTIETTTSLTTPPPEETTNTEPTIPEEINQMCYEAAESELSQSVVIKAPRAGLKINENEYGDVMLQVERLSENYVLIWFSLLNREMYYTGSEEISCVFGATNSLPIYNLKEKTTYTFCLMNPTEKTVSPLDCISYTKGHNNEQSWLLNGNKTTTITIVIITFCISVFIGLALGFFTFKKIIRKREQDQNHKMSSCINEVLKETLQSNSIMRKKSRMSIMTTNSANTKRTTVDYYIDAPPLPARPHSMYPFDEPIYAVVRP